MDPIPAARLLDLWEAGHRQSRVAWAQSLLSAAAPDTTADALETLTVGERNRRLLGVREALFGPRLDARATCPCCGSDVELELDVRALPTSRTVANEGRTSAGFTHDDYRIAYRVPSAADLLAVEQCSGVAQAKDMLLRRCVLGASRNGVSIGVTDLSDEVLAALSQQMDDADPGADVSFTLVCPDCGEEWSLGFDVVSYVWAEIDASARATLQDVHTLASAYGWTEREVLALSATRRAHYLELATA